MILSRHSLETNAAADALWRRWLDLSTWPEWDPGLAAAGLEGPFQTGTRGHLDLKAGGRLPFTLAAVEPGSAFLLEAALPGARLRLLHRLEPSPHGVRLVREARLEGWLAWFQARRLKSFQPEPLAAALRALARLTAEPG